MRTSRFIISIAAAAACLLGFSGCTKSLSGLEIRFRAMTSPSAPVTKTAFSGETYDGGGKTYERIDWSDGDIIVLAMKNNETAMATQNYSVHTISTAGVNSRTDLKPSGAENGLTWGEGTHDFWSGYPASKVTVGDHTLSATIPAAQVAKYSRKTGNVVSFTPDMSDAIMVASLQCVPADNGINLDFYPAFTTFDFTVGANDNITITSFEMETSTYETETSTTMPLAGGVTATFDPAAGMACSYAASGSTSNTVSLVFHNENGDAYNPIITPTTSMNFKVFALPQDITGIRITFNLNDGTHRSLRLKQSGNWITFPAAAKINISGLLVPGAIWYINFDYPRQEQWIVHNDIEIGVE